MNFFPHEKVSRPKQKAPVQRDSLDEASEIMDQEIQSAIRTDLVVRSTEDESKLNKTEKVWLDELRRQNHPFLGVQNITFKLGSDCRYTPDFIVVTATGELIAYEVKGFMRDDALVKLKVTARIFRFLKIIVVRQENRIWKQEEVQP